MTWLTSLGFLGLLGLAVLLLIYLLKPNFQQQSVSSTFIWKLSLKYKRRKNPISKIRNLLILLCQILIITACSFILAQPAIADVKEAVSNEKVVVIDASASMRMTVDDETRFERAVNQASEYCDGILAGGGTVTVILADEKAEYLTFRITEESAEAATLVDKFEELLEPLACSFGKGDIDGAMKLAENITIDNPQAEVVFYTGTQYIDKGKVTVIDVSDKQREWNVAVLDCRLNTSDGYYEFEADVACFGRNVDVTLNCDLEGVNPSIENDEGTKKNYSAAITLMNDEIVTVRFAPQLESSIENEKNNIFGFDEKPGIYSFKNAMFYIEANDSFDYDNSYNMYGGNPEVIKIQYYSTKRNPFFSIMLVSLPDVYKDKFDIQVTEVTSGDPAQEGFDLYIYEHAMPKTLPNDGVVWLVDPDYMPSEIRLTIGDRVSTDKENMFYFSAGEKHPITDYIVPESIGVTQYTRILDWAGSDFTPILYCEGDPVLLCKNELVEGQLANKVIIMPFSVHMSSLVIDPNFGFPSLFYGIFEYYLPSTTEKRVYEVNENISVRARSSSVRVDFPDGSSDELKEFPAVVETSRAGIYTFTQELISKKKLVETVFVKVPNDESNIARSVDRLQGPLQFSITETNYIMNILYILLGVLVALLFVEWWLSSRSGV